MKTRRLSGSDPRDVEEAARILRDGGLVALPTETVYGLAARGLDERAVRSIFEAKGRPQDNPVILHVASAEDALPLWSAATTVDEERALARARTLAGALWPGPLTIVHGRSAVVPDVVTAGLQRVAVRVPAHDVFVRVVRLLGEPLAAPSANASGRPSPTSADDVLESLDGRIHAVVDGGACRYGIESTVVDVTGPRPRVLRPGATRLDEIRAFLPDVEERAAGLAAHADEASPGLRHKHYAPAVAEVVLVDDVTAAWASGDGLLVRASTAAGRAARAAPTEVLPDDVAGYARGLYAALYRLERAKPARVVVERVPEGEAWTAVRDRVLRATS